MSPLDTFRNHWLPAERRTPLERRRARDRRLRKVSVVVERRAESPPRRGGVDRRESPAGHIRNALQMLRELAGAASFDQEQQLRLESLERRLWLAVAEVERLALRPAPVSAPGRSAAAFR